MGKIYDHLDSTLVNFIERQQVFFVGTAPLSPDGHINCSPKGLDTFVILDEKRVAYLDFVGSTAETIAHLRENGRIVLMFCAFDGTAKILRLHGHGRVLTEVHEEYAELRKRFQLPQPNRAIIEVELSRISDACGIGVPLFDYRDQRSGLLDWSEKKGEAGAKLYQATNNRESIDGLPAVLPRTIAEKD